MANVTVNFDSVEYTVQNEAKLSRKMITQEYCPGVERITLFEHHSMSLNDENDPGSKGVLKSQIITQTIGGAPNEPIIRIPVVGIFDESVCNDVGFTDLLHVTAINAVFLKLLNIEPLNLDGTVKPEYQ